MVQNMFKSPLIMLPRPSTLGWIEIKFNIEPLISVVLRGKLVTYGTISVAVCVIGSAEKGTRIGDAVVGSTDSCHHFSEPQCNQLNKVTGDTRTYTTLELFAANRN